MATKKKARPKKAAKRPAARKPASRKTATVKRASPKSSSKPISKRRKRVQRVRAVVEEKARQGLDAAREGLERIKQTTVSLVEEVKDRIGNRDTDGMR